jgi:hypothetical protein
MVGRLTLWQHPRSRSEERSMGRIRKVGKRAFAGAAALTLSVAAVAHAQQAQPTTPVPQQGPGAGPPPPGPATPVQDNELVETWNERVSAGPPVGAYPEYDGWSLGLAMPLARSEHAVVELDGRVWVLGGYPPGRLPSNLVQIHDPVAGRWTLGPRLPQPIHHVMAAVVDGRLYVIGGRIFLPGGAITLGGNTGTNAQQVYRPTMRCE